MILVIFFCQKAIIALSDFAFRKLLLELTLVIEWILSWEIREKFPVMGITIRNKAYLLKNMLGLLQHRSFCM